MQTDGSEEQARLFALQVPVTILTGFLGAGKTARLNASLREGRSRIAVIENEIGSLGVDGALVANAHAEADGVIELANGCLCCSAEVDLIAALEALIRRHRERAVDRILIETTGLADVGPVISLLDDAGDPLAEDLYLDGVVTVVDVNTLHRWAPGGAPGPGRHEQGAHDISVPSWSSGFGYNSGVPQVLSLGKAAVLKTFWRQAPQIGWEKQVAFADQIILSKCDLASAAVEEVATLLENVNPLAEVLPPSDSSLPPLPPLRRRPAVGRRPGPPAPAPAPASFCGATVPKLRTEVCEDEACKKLLDDLLGYAVYAVTKHEADIKDTLKNRIQVRRWPVDASGTLEVDVIWPGAGYNSVACGGSFAVLSLIEAWGLLRVRDIVGASGGAASAILALADPERSSRTLLTYYMVYAKWTEQTPRASLRQLWRTTPLWAQIYRKVIQDDAAFERVRQRGYVAVAAGRTVFQWQNWILHHFANREQCVQAYEASGEASLSGAFVGREIDGLKRLGRCCDGGGVLPFPGREKKVAMYHHSFYGSATACTMETIEKLFRKGVDDTITMLCDSYDTCKFRTLEYGGAILGFGSEMVWDSGSPSGLRTAARYLNAERDDEAGHLDAVDRRTVILPEGARLMEDSLRRLAKELLLGEAGRTSTPGAEVWRIKGLVQISGRGVMLLQGVGDQVSLETWADPVKVFFLVFIGVELGQEVLEAAVAACRDRSEPSQALADVERSQPLLYRQPNLAIADWLSIRIGAGPADCVPMFGGGFFGGGGGGEGRGPAGFFGQNARGNFKAEYDVYPVSFMGKEELEKGNKIILPQSALDRLARLNISWPMLFEMTNVATSRSTHGGVQEFSAEEGVCYFPYWMMQNLLLEVGSRVEITNTSLPKGSFVKLQPVHSDFLEIHNPRAVLENSLRNFATLTVGDCIVIDYNQRKYEIEIAECKPTKAISIIEADVNVDFAPPKDYQEPPPPSAAAEIAGASFATKVEEADAAAPEETAAALFGGSGQRVDGKPIRTPQSSPAAGPSPPPMPDEEVLMPWIKRIPGGVKWTSPPYGYGESHMTGAKA
ncbi:Ufd1 [Symbiodinium sp. CCMP2592]|nr:Ufd1 [Symbiodinium sp. CCMP2592]